MSKPTHPTESARLKAKVASLTSELQFKEPKFQILLGAVAETAHLREEVKRAHTESSDFDVSLQSL